jgi:hypothetical protein
MRHRCPLKEADASVKNSILPGNNRKPAFNIFIVSDKRICIECQA